MKPLQSPLWLAALRARLKTSTSWALAGRISGAITTTTTTTPPPPWRRAMTCLATVTSLLLLVTLACGRPFSLLYRSVHGQEALGRLVAERNEQRASQALHYLGTLPKKTERELQALARPPGLGPRGGRPGTASREQRWEGLKDGEEDGQPEVSFTFTIGIITVSRKQPPNSNVSVSYLLQSAAALHELTQHSPLFRHRAFLFVCNVDAYPANHQDAALLRDLLPYAERYGGASLPGVEDLAFPGGDDPATATTYRSLRHKYREGLEGSLERERHDYAYCLQAARAVPARYYLLFQDDAVPLPGFADVLSWTLAKLSKCPHQPAASAECSAGYPPYTRDLSALQRARARTGSPSPEARFGYLKLYFPDRWNGFSFEGDRLAELVCLMMVGGGLALAIHWAGGGCRLIQGTGGPTWRVFLLGAALALGGCQLLGRQNVNELRRASRYLYKLQPSPDCCIPAMLYPAPVLPYLVSWLADSPPASKVDLRIADCFRHYDMVTYYIEPNIVRHVGVVTSIDKKNEKPIEEFLLL